VLLPVTTIRSWREFVEAPCCPEKFMAKGILVKEPVQIGAKCALVLAHTAIFEDVARFRLSLESCKWASARQVCCFTGMNLISAKPIHMDLFTEEE